MITILKLSLRQKAYHHAATTPPFPLSTSDSLATILPPTSTKEVPQPSRSTNPTNTSKTRKSSRR